MKKYKIIKKEFWEEEHKAWIGSDLRKGMLLDIPYEVIETDNEWIQLYNPHQNTRAYFLQETLSKSITREKNPEYFL